jgi:hypothetical protein
MTGTPIFDALMREQRWRHATRTRPTSDRSAFLDTLVPDRRRPPDPRTVQLDVDLTKLAPPLR